MAKVISLYNQNGGVSKTTTCANPGFSLAKQGRKALLIDASHIRRLPGACIFQIDIRNPQRLIGSGHIETGKTKVLP